MTETRLFKATVNPVNGIPVIELSGEINGFSQKTLDLAFNAVQFTGAPVILLDFKDVEYINSTGIALIVSLLSRARRNGQSLAACGLSHHYQEIFNVTRLSQYIPMYPDVYTALGAISLPE